jgi:hypothetical protein
MTIRNSLINSVLGSSQETMFSESTVVAPSADWASWDGTNDGSVTQLATGGGTGAQDIAAVSDTEAVMIYQDADNNVQAVVVDIADKAFDAIDTNTPVQLTHADGTGFNIVKLSDTKFLCLYESTTSGSTGVVALLTKSGKTLTETDVETSLNLTTPNFRCALTELSGTKAAAVMRDDGDTSNGQVFVIDTNGDNITIGTRVDINSTLDYPAICKAKADGSAFWVGNTDVAAEDSAVRYFSVSGTNCTEEARIDVDAASNQYDDMMAAYIADDVCVMAYENAGGSSVDANAYSWDGENITRGTAATAIFGSNDIFQGTGTVTELPNRCAMFASRMQDESPQAGAAVVVSVSESLVCTASTKVNIFPGIQADHNVVDVTPSGLYVFACCQDETTVPIQQIGTRVLDGTA